MRNPSRFAPSTPSNQRGPPTTSTFGSNYTATGILNRPAQLKVALPMGFSSSKLSQQFPSNKKGYLFSVRTFTGIGQIKCYCAKAHQAAPHTQMWHFQKLQAPRTPPSCLPSPCQRFNFQTALLREWGKSPSLRPHPSRCTSFKPQLNFKLHTHVAPPEVSSSQQSELHPHVAQQQVHQASSPSSTPSSTHRCGTSRSFKLPAVQARLSCCTTTSALSFKKLQLPTQATQASNSSSAEGHAPDWAPTTTTTSSNNSSSAKERARLGADGN